MQETDKIWMNGELVDWADAKVHVGIHGLHYGSGIFEGIRCYETEKGPAVFRLPEHLERFENSAKVLFMDLPYSVGELREATHELVARNGLATCYLRPIAFYGYGELGVACAGNPVDVVIMSFPWGAYLGEEGQSTGISTGRGNTGASNVAMIAAEVSLNSERACSPGTSGFHGTGWDTMSQNSLSRSMRFTRSLPAMIAALMAPIDMPSIHSGSKSK